MKREIPASTAARDHDKAFNPVNSDQEIAEIREHDGQCAAEYRHLELLQRDGVDN
jgi:hypothetical protein